ncbi:MAG: LysM peptidoglycan-binding domain-containing protein [Rhodobiaceae bacterium]|nr:LysM peptidoglycan-binding domain-containing protein [Rhodobiaceae bacterium]MCC0057047.1 LysM peptidoglycan-binding domain-containing protein [Rhodobiaceae bacterium]
MRSEYLAPSNNGLFRILAVSMLALTAGACSSDVTRFSEPMFSSDVTGSVAPIPSEPVGSATAYAANTPGNGYGGSYGNTYNSGNSSGYTSQPLPAPQASGAPSYQSGMAQSVAPVQSDGATSMARSNYSSGARKTVAPGDTVYSIARAYNVSESELLRANGMSSPSQLRIGQQLVIPGAGMSATVASAPQRSPSPVTQPATPTRTASSGGYVVKQGDTLYTIAHAHNVRVADIAAANNLRNGGQVQVGQEISIPGTKYQFTRTAALQNPATTTDTSVQSGRVETSEARSVKTVPVAAPQPKPQATAQAPEPKAPEAAPQEPVRTASLTEPEARSASEFRWPVRGRVISSFGEKASGRTNDGINISVPVGTSIRAAENGVVAYAGNELEGYGNLVLIRHSDNWVTAYAHAEKLLVKKGDTVKRGQVIAQAGQTGSVDTPQVHFELRQGSRPVDPLKHLSSL